ncbi:MAG: hypothetical protein JWQ35_783 [Bacteriovoracaceae bacterium]|nr:hypothetical protein [Bacteriovoracaceae bacterium]
MKPSEIIPSFFLVGVRDFSFSKELESFLKEFPVPGLILFNSPFDKPSNIWSDRESALEGIYEFIKKASQNINFFAVDQEGGRVRRLRAPFIHLPSAQKIREAFDNTGKMDKIEELYCLAAKQMALTNIHLNFAPVCDFRTKDSSNVVGDRSYGENLNEVFPFVEAFCRVFENEQVHTTLKHFPGHGPTRFDSHERIAVVFKNKRELFKEDREIFLKAAANASAILTAHIAFEDDPETIFSLDQKLLKEFKKNMPAHLVWITDDLLSMKAVSEIKPWLKAFDCEYDFISLCGDLENSMRAIEDTIRYTETSVKDFTQELAIEKRAKRSTHLFREKKELPKFKDWRSKILELEALGNDCLEALQIKF